MPSHTRKLIGSLSRGLLHAVATIVVTTKFGPIGAAEQEAVEERLEQREERLEERRKLPEESREER